MSTTQDIVASTLHSGGITIRIADGCQPADGFMVALAGTEYVVDASTFGVNVVRTYAERYADALAMADAYLGTWLDGGKVYVDTSVRICDRDAAIALGRQNAQLAIYDVANADVITL